MTSFSEGNINRDCDGKFAAKTTGETDTSALGSGEDLSDPTSWSPDFTAAVVSHRETMKRGKRDPQTGAVSPEFVEDEYETYEVANASLTTSTMPDTLRNELLTKSATSMHNGETPGAESRDIDREVEAHVANGGAVLSEHKGDAHWINSEGMTYREGTDVPAVFDDHQPTTWVSGETITHTERVTEYNGVSTHMAAHYDTDGSMRVQIYKDGALTGDSFTDASGKTVDVPANAPSDIRRFDSAVAEVEHDDDPVENYPDDMPTSANWDVDKKDAPF